MADRRNLPGAFIQNYETTVMVLAWEIRYLNTGDASKGWYKGNN